MAQDDGSVHDVPGGQNHGVGHQSVHQGVCCHKVAGKRLKRNSDALCSAQKASPAAFGYFLYEHRELLADFIILSRLLRPFSRTAQ